MYQLADKVTGKKTLQKLYQGIASLQQDSWNVTFYLPHGKVSQERNEGGIQQFLQQGEQPQMLHQAESPKSSFTQLLLMCVV